MVVVLVAVVVVMVVVVVVLLLLLLLLLLAGALSVTVVRHLLCLLTVPPLCLAAEYGFGMRKVPGLTVRQSWKSSGSYFCSELV